MIEDKVGHALLAGVLMAAKSTDIARNLKEMANREDLPDDMKEKLINLGQTLVDEANTYSKYVEEALKK